MDHQKLNKKQSANFQERSKYYTKATKKQIKTMKKLGINFPPGISKESANILIAKKLGL